MATHALKGSDAVMKAVRDISKRMGAGSVSVGFMNGATYPDGTLVSQVAFWNEYGHGGNFPAPPRPFFRDMITKESPTWAGKMAGLAKATNFDGARVLDMMGKDIRDALQQSINDFSSPILSDTTLRLRYVFGNSPEKIRRNDVLQAQEDVKDGKPIASGSQAHPLTWTGHMLNSITHKVNT